jgi:hypothetical protein
VGNTYVLGHTYSVDEALPITVGSGSGRSYVESQHHDDMVVVVDWWWRRRNLVGLR